MEKSTLKSYNDLFKVTDNNSAKFYVLYNTNLTYLLSANEIVTFYQIVHVCNIERNYASLNYLKNLLNMSVNTIKKSIEKLVLLNLIERRKNYNSTFYYTLNLEAIAYIYNNVNSCHRLEKRKEFCKQYIEDCIKENAITPNSAISKNDTTISKIDIAISKFDTPVSKNDTATISKIDRHINNISIKENRRNKEDEFNKENEFYNKDVQVEKTANASNSNEAADANTSFNNLNANKTLSSSSIEKECNSSNNKESSNREQINSAYAVTSIDNSNDTADANSSFNNDKTVISIEDNTNSLAIAKDYYQKIQYSETIEELKQLSNEIKHLSIEENYIDELLQLVETMRKDFNEETANADTSIDNKNEDTFNVEEAIKKNIEFQRYYTNINVAFAKRSIATLKRYEKMFSSNVEYLSKKEIEELYKLASDAKRKLQQMYDIAA